MIEEGGIAMGESGMPGLGPLLARLEADGLLCVDGHGYRTTKRWQGAMMRAAARLMGTDDDAFDLRVPVAHALIELYGDDLTDADLVTLVGLLASLEAHEIVGSGGSTARRTR